MLKDLQFTSPESQGVRSEDILRFLDLIEGQKIHIHSFMFVKNGKILAEAYAKPFIDENFMHREYSCSKTYTSMAIGKLIGDGLLKLDDRLSAYFPEWVDENTPKLLLDVTIEDMLKMSVPANRSHYAGDNLDWAESYFKAYNSTPDIDGGMLFRYDTFATFMLCVLIEKVSGKTYVEVLRPIFDELGIGEVKSVLSPDGYAWGGSGVLSTMRDYAAFGEFLMHMGSVNGKQMIPLDYMKAATSKQISTHMGGYNCYSKTESNGYGYKIWMHPHGFAMLGMYSQRLFCFPEKDFMFVINGDTMVVADRFYDAVEECYRNAGDALPEGEAWEKLQARLQNFTVPTGYGEKHAPIEEEVQDVRYTLCENPMGIRWFSLHIDAESGVFRYENERGVKELPFGLDRFVQSTFPETHYPDIQVGVPANRELRCMNYGAFMDDRTFIIKSHLIDNFIGNLMITLVFRENKAVVKMSKIAEYSMDGYQGLAWGEKA